MPYENAKEQFGIAVKTFRKQRGISQEELAERADLHRTYITDIERGARNASLETMVRVARGLGISLSMLFEPLEHSSESGGGRDFRENHLPNLLLVDDNPVDLEHTLGILRTANVKNHVVAGIDYIAIVSKLPSPNQDSHLNPPNRFGLVLLGLNAPHFGGLKLLQKLKQNHLLRDIPVLVMIRTSFQKDIIGNLSPTFCLQIVKPLSFERFREATVALGADWGMSGSLKRGSKHADLTSSRLSSFEQGTAGQEESRNRHVGHPQQNSKF